MTLNEMKKKMAELEKAINCEISRDACLKFFGMTKAQMKKLRSDLKFQVWKIEKPEEFENRKKALEAYVNHPVSFGAAI